MDEVSPSAGAEAYFLSYSRSDEAFAFRLARDIRAEGIHLWVDQLDIRPSEHWDRAIERAVSACRGIVVLLSPRSVASENVADEISFAINGGKTVLPVMIEQCNLPLRITRMQLIDATGSYRKALQQCVAELRRTSEAAPATGAPGRSPIDAKDLELAKTRLTAILGPIAHLFADKAAGRAASVTELYRQLSQHIENESDRDRFLAWVRTPSPSCTRDLPAQQEASAIPAAEIERLARILAMHLGPIAAHLAKRESKTCATAEDLAQKLAEFIPSPAERIEYLRKVQSP
jgi:hypothetical protein